LMVIVILDWIKADWCIVLEWSGVTSLASVDGVLSLPLPKHQHRVTLLSSDWE